MEHWEQLEQLVKGRFSYTHQQHLDDLTGYMDWVNSCKMLITNDSLGLYLGATMNKKVLGLFGPTPPSDQSPSENLRVLVSPTAPKSVFGLSEDGATDSCMRDLLPQAVFDAIVDWGVD